MALVPYRFVIEAADWLACDERRKGIDIKGFPVLCVIVWDSHLATSPFRGANYS